MIDLRLGDCLEVMKTIEDNSIDAIICDLPYGTTDCRWDTVIPFEPLWEQYKRVIKDNGAIVLFGSEPFSTYLRISNIKMYRYDIIWDKVNIGNPMNAKKMPLKSHENISLFYKKLPTYNPQKTDLHIKRTAKQYNVSDNFAKGNAKKGYTSELTGKYPKSILKISNYLRRNKLHPTQKPIEVLEWLIKTYSNENDTVLDNTMGSGTTMLACKNLNRNGIGIEKDPQNYAVAVARVDG
jgi:site-specific DNA-methyltransferase (adenine-specific)